MTIRINRLARILTVFCLICAMITPLAIQADARASDYLSTYNGSVYNDNGTVYVNFTVSGTHVMEDIGALSINVYTESGTWVKTFLYESTPGMLGHNTAFKAGTVSFSGDANTVYKATVGVYAGRNGGGDTRYFWVYQ